jgi:hypothetical protein
MTFEEIIDFVGQKRRTSVIRIFFGDADDFYSGEHSEKDLRNFVWINYKCNSKAVEKMIARFDEIVDAKDFAAALLKHFSANHIDAKVVA